MKKLKFNWKGLVAILVVATSLIILIHDFIKLVIGYSYTAFGFATIVLVIMAFSEANDYIIERLKKGDK